MELPLKAVLPANFLTGRDSPVSDAWSTCACSHPLSHYAACSHAHCTRGFQASACTTPCKPGMACDQHQLQDSSM